MDAPFYALLTLLIIFIVVIIAMVVSNIFYQYKEQSEAQKLISEIEQEAKRKRFDAEHMIINALKRVLEDIRSL